MTAPGRGCNILFLFFFAFIAMAICLWMMIRGTAGGEFAMLARAEGRRDANYGLISQLKSNKYEWEVTAAGGSSSLFCCAEIVYLFALRINVLPSPQYRARLGPS